MQGATPVFIEAQKEQNDGGDGEPTQVGETLILDENLDKNSMRGATDTVPDDHNSGDEVQDNKD